VTAAQADGTFFIAQAYHCAVARFLHVQAWLDRGLARPAVQRGLEVTAA
jgi:glutathione S-transferase